MSMRIAHTSTTLKSITYITTSTSGVIVLAPAPGLVRGPGPGYSDINRPPTGLRSCSERAQMVGAFPFRGDSMGKRWCSFDEQVALLAERGLRIRDPEAAKRLLKQVGYYRLSEYLRYWKVIQGVVLKAYSASAAVMVCSNVSRGRR